MQYFHLIFLLGLDNFINLKIFFIDVLDNIQNILFITEVYLVYLVYSKLWVFYCSLSTVQAWKVYRSIKDILVLKLMAMYSRNGTHQSFLSNWFKHGIRWSRLFVRRPLNKNWKSNILQKIHIRIFRHTIDMHKSING